MTIYQYVHSETSFMVKDKSVRIRQSNDTLARSVQHANKTNSNAMSRPDRFYVSLYYLSHCNRWTHVIGTGKIDKQGDME